MIMGLGIRGRRLVSGMGSGRLRTNRALWSEQFNNAVWTKSNASVTADATAAPDGATTADTLITTATAATCQTQQAITATLTAAQTSSVFLKAATATKARVRMVENGGSFANAGFVDVDLSVGTLSATTATGAATGISAAIQAYPDGWCRVSLTGTLGGAVGALAFQVYVTSTTSFTFGGTIGQGIYVWGAQCEVGGPATAYIPTAGAAASAP
jgi:hypothetical protein